MTRRGGAPMAAGRQARTAGQAQRGRGPQAATRPAAVGRAARPRAAPTTGLAVVPARDQRRIGFPAGRRLEQVARAGMQRVGGRRLAHVPTRAAARRHRTPWPGGCRSSSPTARPSPQAPGRARGLPWRAPALTAPGALGARRKIDRCRCRWSRHADPSVQHAGARTHLLVSMVAVASIQLRWQLYPRREAPRG